MQKLMNPKRKKDVQNKCTIKHVNSRKTMLKSYCISFAAIQFLFYTYVFFFPFKFFLSNWSTVKRKSPGSRISRSNSENGQERKRGFNRQTDAPRSKTIIHFHTEVCAARVQSYFRFTENSWQGQYYNTRTVYQAAKSRIRDTWTPFIYFH